MDKRFHAFHCIIDTNIVHRIFFFLFLGLSYILSSVIHSNTHQNLYQFSKISLLIHSTMVYSFAYLYTGSISRLRIPMIRFRIFVLVDFLALGFAVATLWLMYRGLQEHRQSSKTEMLFEDDIPF